MKISLHNVPKQAFVSHFYNSIMNELLTIEQVEEIYNRSRQQPTELVFDEEGMFVEENMIHGMKDNVGNEMIFAITYINTQPEPKPIYNFSLN